MDLFDFSEELRKQLACPSCGNTLNEPVTLNCLHTICQSCILRHQGDGWLSNYWNNKPRLICPACKTTTSLPDGNVKSLRPSSYVEALLTLLRAFDKISNEHCENINGITIDDDLRCECCKKMFSKLFGFCSDCSGLVCKSCVNLHVNTKKHQGHVLVALEEFNEEHLDSYIKAQTFCQENFHGKNGPKKIYYFCQEEGCQRCICRRCCLLEHRKHKLLSLDEMVEKFGNMINEDMSKMEKLSNKMEDDINDLEIQFTRFDNEIKVAIQKVHNTVESVVRKAREHEEQVVKSLEKRLQEYNTMNQQTQKDLKENKKQLDDFISRCKKMTEKNKWELGQIQKDVARFYRVFSLKIPASSRLVKRNRSTVHYVTDYIICQSVKDIGKVVESVTDQSHCPIEFLQEPRYGFVNDLDIVTRNSKGEMSMATRWKRTFLWSKSKLFDDRLPRVTRSHSVA